MRVAIVLLASAAFLLAGCPRARKDAPATSSTDAGAASLVAADAGTKAPRGCVVQPAGGVAIPGSAKATDVRLAASGSKALVTWYETTKRADGPDVWAAAGHVFDGTNVGARLDLDKVDLGDEFISGAAPVASGAELQVVSCFYEAPSGRYTCSRGAPGVKGATTLLDFKGIASGGPTKPGIAAVVKGEDALVFVPKIGAPDVLAFSARVSGKKKGYAFPARSSDDLPFSDGLGAVPTGEDEAAVVYRWKSTVYARRSGFDETWRSKTELSAKGALVGAPVVATDGHHVVTLFSERAKATDPWRVMVAEFAPPAAEVKRAELPTGEAQAQGPGIARTTEPGCFLVSWVEGTGKTTRTRIARACNGTIAKDAIVPLSGDGVEGGRATLAADPANAKNAFVVWQEIPAGKPAELRIAALACR